MTKNDWFKFTKHLEELQSKSLDREYRKIINLIQKEAIRLQEQNLLTKGNLNKFIRGLNVDSMLKYDLSMLDSFVTGHLRLPKSELKILAKVYKHPLILANKVHQFSLSYNQGANPNNFKGVNQKMYLKMSVTFDKNAKFLQKLSSDYIKEMKHINKIVTTDLSRNILYEYKALKRDRINLEDGTKRPLTKDEINKSLRITYKNASARTERIIRTEVHSQQQVVGQAVAIQENFSKKTWHNRPNAGLGGPVRGTNPKDQANHLMLDGVTIPIKDKFILKNGKAQYPGDTSLPPSERINCRCELTYS